MQFFSKPVQDFERVENYIIVYEFVFLRHIRAIFLIYKIIEGYMVLLKD